MKIQNIFYFLKRLSFLFVITVITISCSDDDSTTSVETETETEITVFKVMSYNISGVTFLTHKDSIVAQIQRNAIDVLGVQELRGTNKTELTTALGGDYSLLETFPSDTNISTHNIVYNNQTFSAIDYGYFETQLCGPRRFINWALLEKRDDNKQYYIYNNHLCNTDLELKKYHLVDLVNLMETHQTQAGAEYKAIITGDFNSSEGTEFIEFVLGNGSLTIDTDTLTNPVNIIDSWNAINPGTAKPSQGNVAVDWVFATPNIEIVSSSVDMSGANAQNELPSDHSPVITSFKPE